jgi:hypothetical protein
MRIRDKYRFRSASGREHIIEAELDVHYVDHETGETLFPVAKLTPVSPTASELPWAVENLRFCNHCDQLCQRDLSVCTTCGQGLDPLPARNRESRSG